MAKETIEVGLKNKSGILKCSNPQTFRLVREKFSTPNPNYKMRHLRKYVITPIGAFEVGLWHEIEKYVLSLGKPVDIRLSNEFKTQYKPSLKNVAIQPIDGFTYYDYQEFSLNEMLGNGRGIILSSTASGKSVLIGGLCKSINLAKPNARILIVVPNTSLLNQIYYSFLDEFKLPIIERWGDQNIPTFEKPVLVANMQILSSDINYTIEVLKNYDYVIVDEVHRVGMKETYKKNKKGEKVLEHQLSKIIHNIQTPNKWGLTGTLPDNLLACWNVIGKIGPILYEKSSYEVRKQGTATQVQINVIYMNHSEKVGEPMIQITNDDGTTTEILDTQPTAKYNAERVFLYRSIQRNDIIRKLATKLDGNILILIDNIEHGEILQKVLETPNKIVYFIRGSVDTETRRNMTNHMEKETGIICIAMSQCFSTGVSVKNLHHLILSYVGKSTVKIMQSIGRLMRLHESKDLARIYDLADNTTYSRDHLTARLKLYKREKLDYKTKKINL